MADQLLDVGAAAHTKADGYGERCQAPNTADKTMNLTQITRGPGHSGTRDGIEQALRPLHQLFEACLRRVGSKDADVGESRRRSSRFQKSGVLQRQIRYDRANRTVSDGLGDKRGISALIDHVEIGHKDKRHLRISGTDLRHQPQAGGVAHALR